tara:strand:+ start:87 stop:263 length:177 start_codon:yes stop_codon:yes gene_type:complete
MEYQRLSATGTPEIAGVIDRQPEMSDAVRVAVHQLAALDVGTLVFVAVSVGVVGYGVL